MAHPASGVIPEAARVALEDPAYARTDTNGVEAALAGLASGVPPLFQALYRQYEGPFEGHGTGFVMLDLVSGTPNVVSLTAECRELYGFGLNHVVLSDVLGNAVLVLDTNTDHVFNVDFEGGEAELRTGTLSPQWTSFAAFLEAFFSERTRQT